MIKKIFSLLACRPRLLAATFFAALYFISRASFIGGVDEEGYSRLLISWNIFAISYLIMAIQMILSSNSERIKVRAIVQSEGSVVMMLLVLMAVVSCIASIILELSYVHGLNAQEKISHMILPGLTILSAWFFMHMMFGIQYAHEYYKNQSMNKDPGLEFPGRQSLEYWDFIYAAFILGTSAQTADVSFTTNGSRKIALVHSVTSFFFNTTILALTINIAASVI